MDVHKIKSKYYVVQIVILVCSTLALLYVTIPALISFSTEPPTTETKKEKDREELVKEFSEKIDELSTRVKKEELPAVDADVEKMPTPVALPAAPTTSPRPPSAPPTPGAAPSVGRSRTTPIRPMLSQEKALLTIAKNKDSYTDEEYVATVKALAKRIIDAESSKESKSEWQNLTDSLQVLANAVTVVFPIGGFFVSIVLWTKRRKHLKIA
jgi:hypothetical protein